MKNAETVSPLFIPLIPEEISDACFEAKDKAWYAVADLFDRRSEADGVTYQSLADRISRKKAQVHRWIDASSNMTLQSLGLLAAGLNADVVIKLEPRVPSDRRSNFCHPADDAAQMIALRVNAWAPDDEFDTHSSLMEASRADSVMKGFTYKLEMAGE